MARVNARQLEYVPQRFRAAIEKLSKVALAEIAWDFAIESTGNENEEEAWKELLSRHEIIKQWRTK